MLKVGFPWRKISETASYMQDLYSGVLLGSYLGEQMKARLNREKLVCDKSQQNPQPIHGAIWNWDGVTELSQIGEGGRSLYPSINHVACLQEGSITLGGMTFNRRQSLVRDSTLSHQLPTPNNLRNECFGPQGSIWTAYHNMYHSLSHKWRLQRKLYVRPHHLSKYS